jgi:hypothetical protein
MKKYKINIVDKKSNLVLEDIEKRSILTIARLNVEYKAKYRFYPNPVKITIKRLINKGGRQMDIFDIINSIVLLNVFLFC